MEVAIGLLVLVNPVVGAVPTAHLVPGRPGPLRHPYRIPDRERGSVFGMSSFFPSTGDQTVVIADPVEVERILRGHFSFGVEPCEHALRAGHGRAALATDNSAKSQFGSDMYFGTIEQLRSEIGRFGYSTRTYKGLELARRDDNCLQVTACMASDGAGEVSGTPRPKNPKGSSSEKAIRDNQGTLGLLTPDAAWDPIETWWLLYQLHGVAHARSISAEVSLPNDMAGTRTFGWSIRLILPTIVLNESAITPDLPKQAADVEVPIVRRVG
jgi:hypothetical protein